MSRMKFVIRMSGAATFQGWSSLDSLFFKMGRIEPEEIPDRVGKDFDLDPVTPEIEEPTWIEEIDEGVIISIKYPFRRHICAACWETFINVKALIEHLEQKHADGLIRFQCSKSSRNFPKLQGIAIHYGLCIKGKLGKKTGIRQNIDELPEAQNRFNALSQDTAVEPEQEEQVEKFTCEVCEAAFGTKPGLGQHIRHRHPKLANEKRMAVEADIQRKRAARRKVAEEKPTKPRGNVWSFQEEMELMALCEKYSGERHINKAIEKELRTKTAKQISDKRRTLSLQAKKQAVKPVQTKGKRKVQGVPQSQTAALPRPQEEEETDKSKQA